MAQSSGSPDKAPKSKVQTPDGMFIRDMPSGTRLRLKSGALVEVVENASDGGWLFARHLENADDPELVGKEEWVFFGEVKEELD